MIAALRDVNILGLSHARSILMLEPATAADMIEPVSQAARLASDTLIVYFAGHTLVQSNYALNFALRDTEPGNLDASVSYLDVRDLLLGSNAARVLLIVDSVFHLATREVTNSAEVGVAVANVVANGTPGACIFTSLVGFEAALAPRDERIGAFSDGIIRALEDGLPDGPDVLDLNTVFTLTLDRLAVHDHSFAPQLRDSHAIGSLPFVVNNALERELRAPFVATTSRHAFISYARADRAYLEQLASYVRDAGVRVWFDFMVEVGDRFGSRIAQAIDDCFAFILILSPASVSSRWVQRELSYADEKHKPIFPLLLAACDSPVELAGVQRLDVSDGRMPTLEFVGLLRNLNS